MKKVRDLLFSVDPRRRRWRPRPIALVILGIALLVIVGGLAWGISSIRRAAAIAPIATSTPTAVSSTNAVTDATGDAVSPIATPTVTVTHPVTWTVRLGRDPEGRIVGVVTDPAVRQAVKQDFLEAWEWAFQSESPHNAADVERYFAPLPQAADDPIFQPDAQYWYGLESAHEDLERESNQGVLTRASLSGGAWNVAIERFSTDGKRAVVRGRYEDGTCTVDVLDVTTGESLTTSEGPCAVYAAGMVYDTRDGRWKVATLRQWIP